MAPGILISVGGVRVSARALSGRFSSGIPWPSSETTRRAHPEVGAEGRSDRPVVTHSLLDEDDDVDTIGGLVFAIAGSIPVRGEIVRHPAGVEFEVLDADPRRIKRLRISRIAPSAEPPDGGGTAARSNGAT